MGSFDEWVHTVGGILAVAGVDGFLANAREVLEQSDPDVDVWWGLLALARSHLPHYWTAADLAAEVEAAGLGGDELPADFGETDRPGFASRVAYALRKKCGRRFGSCRLNRAADPSRHARYWIEVTGSEPRRTSLGEDENSQRCRMLRTSRISPAVPEWLQVKAHSA